MQGDSEQLATFTTRRDANSRFAKRLNASKRLVAHELRIIEEDDRFIFDSPYIVWAAVVRLPIRNASVSEARKHLSALNADRRVSVADVRKLFVRYEGWIYTPDETSYPLSEHTISGFLTWVS